MRSFERYFREERGGTGWPLMDRKSDDHSVLLSELANHPTLSESANCWGAGL